MLCCWWKFPEWINALDQTDIYFYFRLSFSYSASCAILTFWAIFKYSECQSRATVSLQMYPHRCWAIARPFLVCAFTKKNQEIFPTILYPFVYFSPPGARMKCCGWWLQLQTFIPVSNLEVQARGASSVNPSGDSACRWQPSRLCPGVAFPVCVPATYLSFSLRTLVLHLLQAHLTLIISVKALFQIKLRWRLGHPHINFRGGSLVHSHLQGVPCAVGEER